MNPQNRFIRPGSGLIANAGQFGTAGSLPTDPGPPDPNIEPTPIPQIPASNTQMPPLTYGGQPPLGIGQYIDPSGGLPNWLPSGSMAGTSYGYAPPGGVDAIAYDQGPTEVPTWWGPSMDEFGGSPGSSGSMDISGGYPAPSGPASTSRSVLSRLLFPFGRNGQPWQRNAASNRATGFRQGGLDTVQAAAGGPPSADPNQHWDFTRGAYVENSNATGAQFSPQASNAMQMFAQSLHQPTNYAGDRLIGKTTTDEGRNRFSPNIGGTLGRIGESGMIESRPGIALNAPRIAWNSPTQAESLAGGLSSNVNARNAWLMAHNQPAYERYRQLLNGFSVAPGSQNAPNMRVGGG